MKKLINKIVPKKVEPKTKPEFDNTELGEYFRQLFYETQEPTEKFAPIVLKTLFGTPNYQQQLSEMFKDKKNSKAVCAKIFTKSDIAYKCFDCEKDPTCVICKECYEKGSHKGHRVVLQKYVSGCCDCGDPDAWKEDGFCSDHPGYAKFKPTTSIDDISNEFRIMFIEVFEKCFYYFFNLVEEFILNPSQILEIRASIVLASLFSGIEFCGEKCMSMYLLVCQLFQQKLNENGRKLLLNSDNLQQLQLKEEPTLCTLTYYECLIAYCKHLNDTLQQKIEEISIKLFVDYDFKKYMALAYCKMIRFIYYPKNEQASFMHTKLTGLNVQLYTAEEFTIIAMNSPYFTSFLELFELMLKSFIALPNESQYYVLMDFYQFFDFTIQKKLGREKLLFSGKTVEKMIDYLDQLNYAFAINITKRDTIDPSIVQDKFYLWEFENKALKLIDIIFIELAYCQNPETKANRISSLTNHFVTIIKRNYETFLKNKERADTYRSFHIPLFRAFGIFIKNLVQKPEAHDILNFIANEMNISDPDLDQIISCIAVVLMKTHGLVKDNEKKAWPQYSPMFDLHCQVHRNPQFRSADIDLFLFQVVILFLDPKELCYTFYEYYHMNSLCKKLFACIQQNKFEKKKFKNAIDEINNSKTDVDRPIALIDEFFNYLISLCTDEISLANLYYQKDKLFEFKRHPEFCKRVYSNVLINVLHLRNKMDFKKIQEVLAQRIVHEKAHIEEAIETVSIFNKSDKTFSLKPEYNEVYEPYIFLKDASLQIEELNALKNKFKNNRSQIDFIEGNKSPFYENSSVFLQKIQDKIFQGPWIELAINLLVSHSNVSKLASNYFKSVLKFIDLALNFYKNQDLTIPNKRLKRLFDRNELREFIKTIRSDVNYEDIHNGIDKMSKMLARYEGGISSEEIIESEEPSSELELKKVKNKEENLKRMMDIKNQFSQKQAAVLKKFKGELESFESETTGSQFICNVCHSNIDPETCSYGITGYYGTSTFYSLAVVQTKVKALALHAQNEEKDTLLKRVLDQAGELDEYMTLTTCGHLIHEDCFQKSCRHNVSQRSKFDFSNEFEYLCSLCKALCNCFVKIRKEPQNSSESTGKGIKEIGSLLSFLAVQKIVTPDPSLEVEQIFSEMVANEVESNESEGYYVKETFLVERLDSLFEQAVNNASMLTLPIFIKKNLEMMRSMRISYAEYFKSLQSKEQTQEFKMNKLIITQYLTLLSLGILDEAEASINKLFFDESTVYSIVNCNPDNFLFGTLQHLLVAFDCSDEDKQMLISKMMKYYIVHKIFQIYLKKKIIKKTKSEIFLATFKTLLQQSINSIEIQEIISGLLPSLKKVVTFYLINSLSSQAEIDKFMNQDYLSDEEELNAYLSIPILETNATKLLSLQLFEFASLTEDNIQSWFPRGLNDGVAETVLSSNVFISDYEIDFQFIDLPSNFYLVSTQYIEAPCTLCFSKSGYGNKCICLLCGVVMCSITCNKSGFVHKNNGNLNNHSLKLHGGTSAFLEFEKGHIYLISSPKNIQYLPLYVDKLGYAFEEKRKDWKEYELDKVLLAQLRDKFIHEKIPQEISYRILNHGKKFYESML